MNIIATHAYYNFIEYKLSVLLLGISTGIIIVIILVVILVIGVIVLVTGYYIWWSLKKTKTWSMPGIR